MPGLPETMYSSQQIHISPMLPQILKQYAKAAIRTQPTDLLRWSTAYFRALSQNETPPEKKRLEYPEPKNYMGFTPGLLKVLLNQIGKSPNIRIPFVDLYVRWDGICMPQDELIKILLSAQIDNAVAMDWYKIIAVAAGYLSDNLTQTMVLICNLLTEEPDGGSAMIPVDIFLLYYKFLAELNLSETTYMLNVHFYVTSDVGKVPSTVDKKLPAELIKISPERKPRPSLGSGSLSIVSNVPPEFEHIFREQELPEKPSIESKGFVVAEDVQNTNQEGSTNKDKDAPKESVALSSISQTQTYTLNSTSEIIDEQDLMSLGIPSSLTINEEESLDTKEEEEEVTDHTKISTHTGSFYEDPSHVSGEPLHAPGETLQTTIKSEESMVKEQFSPTLPKDDDLMSGHEKVPVAHMGSPFSQMESVTSKFLGRVSPHYHLNKYLASGTPSMVTELESRFTTTDMSSETHTLYKEGAAKSEAILVMIPPSEQVRYKIDEVQGIGPSVDPETMATFIKYIEERAAFQHGMIMPRNITSFQCSPLENYKYMKKIEVDEDVTFVGCKNVY